MSECQILVVDDDPDIRESLQEVLEHEGYAVSTASNGQEALERMSGTPAPHVVLLDMMMPVMSGWDVLHAMQAHDKLRGIPVLVVTANAASAWHERVAGLFQKPLNLERILHAIQGLCREAAPAQ